MNISAKGNFTEGPVSKNIMSQAMPIMVAELVNVLYNIVDRIFIGHIKGIGTASLTGVGICLPLISLITAFASLSGMGGSPIFSIARGHGDDKRAKKILETDFTMLLGFSALLMAVIWPFLEGILGLLGGDVDTIPYAMDYFGIYLVGTPFVMISLGMNAFINAQGYPRIGMCSVIIGAVLNTVLDPVFIFTFGLNVKGAAIATVISQFASAAWILYFLVRKTPVSISRMYIDKSSASEILKLGISGFTFKITNSVTQAVVNITLKTWGGEMATMYIAAMSIISSMREVTWHPVSSIVEGYKSVASYNYGARRYDRVSQCITFTLKIALIVAGSLWAVLFFFPRAVASLFTNDTELIEMTVPLMRIFFCSFFMMALMTTSQSTFIALNMPKRAVLFSINRKLVLIVPLTLFLPYAIGIRGAFWAEPISEIVGALLTFSVMYLTVWRHLGHWEEYMAEKNSRKKLKVRKDY